MTDTITEKAVVSIPQLERELASARLQVTTIQKALDKCQMERVHSEKRLAQGAIGLAGYHAGIIAQMKHREPELEKQLRDAEIRVSETEEALVKANLKADGLDVQLDTLAKAPGHQKFLAAQSELAALRGE
jgi:hypothetical protein